MIKNRVLIFLSFILILFVSCKYPESSFADMWQDYSSYQFGMAQQDILSRTQDNYIKICDKKSKDTGNTLHNNMWSAVSYVCGFEAEINCKENLSLVGLELHPIMTAYANGKPIDRTSYDYYHFYITLDGKFVIKYCHYDSGSTNSTWTTVKSFSASEAGINVRDFNTIKVSRNFLNYLMIYVNGTLVHTIVDNKISRYGNLAMDWQLLKDKQYSESFKGIGYVKVKSLQILK